MSTRKKWGNLWIIHVLIFVTQFLRLFKQQLEAKEWEKSLPPAPKQAQGVSTMFNNCSADLLQVQCHVSKHESVSNDNH